MVKLRLPRGINWKHMAVGGAFAICSSYYINKPLIEDMQRKQRLKEQDEAMKIIKEVYPEKDGV